MNPITPAPSLDDYKLELPGDHIEIQAYSDGDARFQAKRYLNERGIEAVGLKLFRYPKEWVNQRTSGLIEVPFYQLK